MIRPILFKKVPSAVLIAAVLALIYVPFFFHFKALYAENPRFDFPIYGKDAVLYVRLADTIIAEGVFSADEAPPYHAFTGTVPGYPFSLALFKNLFGSYDYFPFVQFFLVGLTAWFMTLIGRSFSSERVGCYAAILFMIDPNTLLHSMTLMTDIFFVFLFTLVVFLLFALLPKSAAGFFGRAAGAGAVLGLATFIRSISMFSPMLLGPFFLYAALRRVGIKKAATGFMIFIAAFGAVLSPWIIRNKMATGVAGLAGMKSFNLFHYYLPEYISFSEKISPDDGRQMLRAKLPPFPSGDASSLQNSAAVDAVSFGYLREHFFGYTGFHLFKTIPFFLSSGLRVFFIAYNDLSGEKIFKFSQPNMTNLLSEGRFGEMFAALRANAAVFAEETFWLLVAVLSLAGLFSRRRFFFTLLALAIIAYFAVLTGPIAYARFRLPASPFLFLLALSGAEIIWRRVRARIVLSSGSEAVASK